MNGAGAPRQVFGSVRLPEPALDRTGNAARQKRNRLKYEKRLLKWATLGGSWEYAISILASEYNQELSLQLFATPNFVWPGSTNGAWRHPGR